MYKIRQLKGDWQVYSSMSTNIGDIKIPICKLYVHDYDSEQVKQQAQEYADYLNERDKAVLDVLRSVR